MSTIRRARALSVCLAAPALALAAGCASHLDGLSNEELVRDLVEIRAFDGHSGFAGEDGMRSYGWEAKAVLVERGDAAAPALAAALRDPSLDETQRWIVRHAIGELGPHARLAIPALAEGLRDPDPRTVGRVCMELGKTGIAGAAAVPDLLHVLRERGDEVATPQFKYGDVVSGPVRLRVFAASALAAIGPPAEAAIPDLAQGAVQTEDLSYRQACRRAIRRILGPELPLSH